MTRYRIQVLLLVVSAGFAGASIGTWPFVPVLLLALVLAYFTLRSELYHPDAPVYDVSVVDQVRKWARWVTLCGLAALGVVVAALAVFFLLSIPGIPIFLSTPQAVDMFGQITSWFLMAGEGLLCVGFPVWSGAVFWNNRQKSHAAPLPPPPTIVSRYRVLVVLLVLTAFCVGLYMGDLRNDAMRYSMLFVPLVAAVPVLGSFVIWPEQYNPYFCLYQEGAAARARRRAKWSMLASLVLLAAGMAAILTLPTGTPSGVSSLQLMSGPFAFMGGILLFCGGFFAWCIALFLNRA